MGVDIGLNCTYKIPYGLFRNLTKSITSATCVKIVQLLCVILDVLHTFAECMAPSMSILLARKQTGIIFSFISDEDIHSL